MNCPLDGTELLVAERTGVEIDYCPRCRGVWLDRGELDKIIERASAQMAPAPPAYREPQPPSHGHPPANPGYAQPQYGAFDYKREYKKRKHKNFLDEMFDFD